MESSQPRRASRTSVATDEARGNWGSKLDFFFSCLGYAVGFGNVWRFPYLCFDSGGGAFLIPFFVMLVTIGIPIYFLEVALGQYSACGPVKLFRKMCPLLGGVGYAMVVNTVFIMLYYNVIIAWSLYYLYVVMFDFVASAIAAQQDDSNSTTASGGGDATKRPNFELEWAHCGHDYNTRACQEPNYIINNSSIHSYDAALCSTIKNYNNSAWCKQQQQPESLLLNNTNIFSSLDSSSAVPSQLHAVSPAEEFFYNKLLHISTSINETGAPVAHMVASLGVAWLVAFLCLAKGLKSSGKVVWFTALFPYVVLVILLIRGVTLPGYEEGVKFYMQPDVRKLTEYNIWVRAGAQIFYSLSIGGGGLSTYGSYNKFNNNVFLDATIVPILDCCTSIFAGFVVFAFIGFIAHTLGQPVQAAAREGTALVFIAYPEVITRMPWSILWAIAFNLMMLTLGIDTQFAFIETLTTSVIDGVPRLRRHRTWVYAVVCTASFLVGLIFCTRSGYFWFNLIDYYVAGWPLIFFGLIENLAVLIYGVKRVADEDVHAMLGRGAGWYLKVCWWLISPTIMVGLLLITCFETTPITYEKQPYPMWAQLTGWALACANAGIVPAYALYRLCVISGWCGCRAATGGKCVAPGTSLWERLRLLTEPELDWHKNARKWRTTGGGCNSSTLQQRSPSPSTVQRRNTTKDVEAPLLMENLRQQQGCCVRRRSQTSGDEARKFDTNGDGVESGTNGVGMTTATSCDEYEIMREKKEAEVLASSKPAAAKPDSCFLT